METECHNLAGRPITKALNKGSLGSCLVSTDVGSADKHRAQNLQIPVTAESRVPQAWILLYTAIKESEAPLALTLFW